MTIEITAPENYGEITIAKFKKVQSIIDGKHSDEVKVFKAICALCSMTEKVMRKVPKEAFDDLVNHMSWVMVAPTRDEKFPLIPRVKIGRREYGLIPDFTRLTTGEFIDLENASKGGFYNSLEDVMAILYRPITKSVGDFYEVEPYNPHRDKSKLMKDMMMDVALGAMVFFSHIGRTLALDSLSYLKTQAKEAQAE